MSVRAQAMLHQGSNELVMTLATSAAAERAGSMRLDLDYFTEGGANVLFVIKSPEESDPTVQKSRPQDPVKGKLLRLRKASKIVSSSSSETLCPTPAEVSSREIIEFHDFLQAQVVPKHHMVEHTLVRLGQGVVGECNKILKELESQDQRVAKRCGLYLMENDPNGILIEDMRVGPLDLLAAEFKPKWLVQSPIAPINAKRCRTCAWHVFNKVHKNDRYCPLALVTGDESLVARHFRYLLSRHRQKQDYDGILAAAIGFFAKGQQGHQMLSLLACRQKEYTANQLSELFHLNPEDLHKLTRNEQLAKAQLALTHSSHQMFQALSLAMTLRDCQVLLCFTRNDDGEITVKAKLADLDLKRLNAEKLLKWTIDEASLLYDGYYTGSEAGSVSDSECILWT